MKLSCPHCSQKAMSPIKKMLISPLNQLPCEDCGQAVCIAWRHGVWTLLALLVFLLLIRDYVTGTLPLIVAGSAGAIVILWLQLMLVPLSKPRGE